MHVGMQCYSPCVHWSNETGLNIHYSLCRFWMWGWTWLPWYLIAINSEHGGFMFTVPLLCCSEVQFWWTLLSLLLFFSLSVHSGDLFNSYKALTREHARVVSQHWRPSRTTPKSTKYFVEPFALTIFFILYYLCFTPSLLSQFKYLKLNQCLFLSDWAHWLLQTCGQLNDFLPLHGI